MIWREKLPNDPTQLIERPDDTDVLDGVGQRLVNSTSTQEIVLWTQVRGEILRQNQEAERPKHERMMERQQLYGKLVLSVVAISVGIALIVGGFPTAGLFTLGAGLFWLAPDFVQAYFKKFRSGENNENV